MKDTETIEEWEARITKEINEKVRTDEDYKDDEFFQEIFGNKKYKVENDK